MKEDEGKRHELAYLKCYKRKQSEVKKENRLKSFKSFYELWKKRVAEFWAKAKRSGSNEAKIKFVGRKNKRRTCNFSVSRACYGRYARRRRVDGDMTKKKQQRIVGGKEGLAGVQQAIKKYE